jgi:hypothetical protein
VDRSVLRLFTCECALLNGWGTPCLVDVHGKRLSTIDLFDGHLTLMIGAAGEAWRAAATMLPPGPPFQVLAVGTEISDPTGELVQRYELAGTAAVLVRPDGYISWTGQAAEHDIGETLRRAVTQSFGESVPAADRLVAVA